MVVNMKEKIQTYFRKVIKPVFDCFGFFFPSVSWPFI